MSRRGVVLLAVLIVVAIGAMIGTSLLYSAEAGRRSLAVSLRTEGSRLLAWSGVQAVMAELASQREEILAGTAPRVTGEWVAGPVGAGGGLGVFRIVAQAQGEQVIPEMARLDANNATVEILAKAPGVGQTLAEAIVRERERRPFRSMGDLLRVDGMTAEMLSPRSEGDDTNGVSGLADVLTVFSFDPNVQVGLGPGGSGSAGDRRVNLGVQWSDELGRAVERRFGAEASRGVRGLMSRGVKFERDADVVAQLHAAGLPAGSWAPILDAFTTTEAEYLLGRVDIMTASAEVLACIPGIDQDAAEAIVSRRGRVEGEARSSPAWLVTEGVLTPERFGEAVDHLTTRCMQWRVVIEAGTVPVPESIVGGLGGGGGRGIGGPGTDQNRWEISEDAELADRVVIEAVIDIASRRPRVAYLRDITLLPLAKSLASGELSLAEDSVDEEPPRELVFGERPEISAQTPEIRPPLSGGAAPERGPFLLRAPRSPVPAASALVDAAEEEQPMRDGRIGRWTTGRGGRR